MFVCDLIHTKTWWKGIATMIGTSPVDGEAHSTTQSITSNKFTVSNDGTRSIPEEAFRINCTINHHQHYTANTSQHNN